MYRMKAAWRSGRTTLYVSSPTARPDQSTRSTGGRCAECRFYGHRTDVRDTGTLVVEIWAYDGAGNSDFCRDLHPGTGQHEPVQVTAGSRRIGCNAPKKTMAVENVEVSLSGQTKHDDDDGSGRRIRVCRNLQEGYDYTVRRS